MANARLGSRFLERYLLPGFSSVMCPVNQQLLYVRFDERTRAASSSASLGFDLNERGNITRELICSPVNLLKNRKKISSSSVVKFTSLIGLDLFARVMLTPAR
jgi:hypothetical protein